MLAIELQAVSKTYPGTTEPAVRSVSLEVEKGALVTLLGPSGSGKTTILRLIAGFERAGAGEINLAGKQVGGAGTWVPPEKRGVGMVFQDYALFPHLTVARNVGFGYTERDKQARIREVLDLVDLTGYEARYPHELSGGQQQRVALARALARRPVVVLLDEPFSNLDAALRVHMRMELRRILKAADATAIFVSHDQADALAISDRIVVLKDGMIQQAGSPREIYQSPRNRFVASFVGQSYLLEGVVGLDARSVTTDLGTFPCNPSHSYRPGDAVYACIRPEGLEVVAESALQGTITGLTYTGRSLDATIEVRTDRTCHALPVQLPPGIDARTGATVSLRVAPDAVVLVPIT
jgi:iron(III) transport system ATP-binding protein